MIYNQMLQKTIDEIKELAGTSMAVLNPAGQIVVQNYSGKEITPKKVASFVRSAKETAEAEGFQLLKISEDDEVEYVLAVKGTTKNELVIGRIVKYQLEMYMASYREKFDKDNFFRSLILDNLLQMDIYSQAKKLNLDTDAKGVVLLMETQSKKADEVMRIIKFMFANSADTAAFTTGKINLVVVKKLEPDETEESIYELTKTINETLMVDIGEEVYISYGTIAKDITEISKSYREAKAACDIRKIFFENQKINSFDRLGIGRLVYQLPLPVCKRFINEIFGTEQPPEFDEEMIETMNKFLECSLNVSETSRQLFIHRNTLVYRLDRMQKTTGLDLRKFDDAITFKLAMMVSKYMKHVENSLEK